ncbi:MAG: hypothetical protein WCP31_07435, partial [Chloroflexales bacterium]
RRDRRHRPPPGLDLAPLALNRDLEVRAGASRPKTFAHVHPTLVGMLAIQERLDDEGSHA